MHSGTSCLGGGDTLIHTVDNSQSSQLVPALPSTPLRDSTSTTNTNYSYLEYIAACKYESVHSSCELLHDFTPNI